MVIGYKAPIRSRTLSTGNQKSILFLASGGQSNQASARRFLNFVLPQIQAVMPEVRVRFAGRVCDQLGCLPACCVSEGVVEELDTLMSTSDVMVNAETFGTGLCIKNLTALQFGVPLVTTRSGSRGIEAGAVRAFLVGEDDNQIADMTVQLLGSPQFRMSLSVGALEFVTEYNQLQNEAMQETWPL